MMLNKVFFGGLIVFSLVFSMGGFTNLSHAFNVSLGQRLLDRNELLQVKRSEPVFTYLHNPEILAELNRWVSHKDNRQYVRNCATYMGRFFRNPAMLGPICYFLRRDTSSGGKADTGARREAKKFIRLYHLEMQMLFLELSEDPRLTETDSEWGYESSDVDSRVFRARALYDQFRKHSSVAAIDSIFSRCFEKPGALNFNHKTKDSKELFSKVSACLNDLPGLVKATITDPDDGIWIEGLATGHPYLMVDLYGGLRLDPISSLPVPFGGELDNQPGHAVSETGWIAGNLVNYLTENDYSTPLLLDLLVRSFQFVDTHYALTSTADSQGVNGTVTAFLEKDWTEVFVDERVFTPIAQEDSQAPNLVWNQDGGIFHEILKNINESRDTLFIDIFFLGGQMGATIAKHIIRRIETTPNPPKVLILHDNYNDFGFNAEMRPIFNFLYAYSLKNPEKLIIFGSHIELHPPAFPRLFHHVVDKTIFETSPTSKPVSTKTKMTTSADQFFFDMAIEQFMHTKSDALPLYWKGKSDHSKILVKDGMRSDATALIGSKNWTDSSGAVCYDHVVKVRGPAAVVAQDDYYFDMKYAMTKESILQDQDPGFNSYMAYLLEEGKIEKPLPKSYVEYVARYGWVSAKHDNSYAWNAADTKEKMASQILLAFDYLNRDSGGVAQSKSPTFKVDVFGEDSASADYAVIRSGYNNVDSTRVSALDQVLQMIYFAKERIRIMDQFLFDRNVVYALIDRAQWDDGIDIKVILEPLASADGFPNRVFLDQMAAVGIQTRFMEKTYPEGKYTFAQEYHMKTISADSKFVISGSANKDSSTMGGSFRDHQLDIYSEGVGQTHDAIFNVHWKQSAKSPFNSGPGKLVDPFGFKIPEIAGQIPTGPSGAKLGNSDEDKAYVLQLMRDINSMLFDARML